MHMMQLNDSLASAYMWSQIPTNKYPIYVLFYGLKLKKNEIENEKKNVNVTLNHPKKC